MNKSLYLVFILTTLIILINVLHGRDSVNHLVAADDCDKCGPTRVSNARMGIGGPNDQFDRFLWKKD